MFSRIKSRLDGFIGSFRALPALDVVASTASATDSLDNRLQWLVDVVQWIRRPGTKEQERSMPDGQLQAGRLRRFLDVLDRNPEWKKSVASTLRSIIRDTSALELFSETGLPRQFGLMHEIRERLGRKILPAANTAELGVLFDRLFPHAHDDVWIETLDETTLQRFHALLNFEVAASEAEWDIMLDEIEDALFNLAAQLRVSGGSAAIRARIKHERIRELPFFKIGNCLQAIFNAVEKHDRETMRAELNYLHSLVASCYRSIDEVMSHLEKRGVSTEVVYQLAFIEASLERLEVLVELRFNENRPLTQISAFMAMLVRKNRSRESIMDLLRQNFHLLTRKILERNGETGEHYIARTPREYLEMLRRASGGGILMSFTTWFKIIILSWHWVGLWEGMAASLNYAVGFVAIQLTGSTLATKQPANTGAALAARMHQVRDPQAHAALVSEIVCLIRSQFVSVVGNIALVVPAMLVLHFLVLAISGHPPMTEKKAIDSINSFSIFGPSIFYAAFTGVLLWASSMVAAWTDNWFVCHNIAEAVERDRRLLRILGTSRTLRFGRFWRRNVSGLAGNISFGFMLGLIPAFARFAGLPLDIRHVTLSSSMVAEACATLGTPVLSTAPFWLSVIGVLMIGVMNVSVSFALAIATAIRARRIQGPERAAIYQGLWQRLLLEPLSFILPVGTSSVPVSPPVTAAVKA